MQTIIGREFIMGIIQNICANWAEVLLGHKYQCEKINNKIQELIDFISKYEPNQNRIFLDDLQATFSIDNIKKILKDVNATDNIDMESVLKEELEELCQTYNTLEEGKRFRELIIELFFKVTVECNPELANRLFYCRLSNQHGMIYDKLVAIECQNNKILANQDSYLKDSNPKQLTKNNNQILIISKHDEDLFNWELNYPRTDVLFGDDKKKKKTILQLIETWNNERNQYPGWFIIPVEKRECLCAFTRDESLIWTTKDLLFQDRFDFVFELLWRYEKGMKLYSHLLQEKVYCLFIEYININDWSNVNNNEKWFFIGRSLLREFREDMNWKDWQYVYEYLLDKSSLFDSGKEELNLEYIKQLFFKMKISDVKSILQECRFSENSFAIKLQVCGMMAECGLLQEAKEEVSSLIKYMKNYLAEIDEDNKREIVYIRSVIVCSQELLSFIIQGMNPFDRTEELRSLWDQKEENARYYDFEKEKSYWTNNLYNYYCKHKEEPFELNRNIRTKTWGEDGFEKIYGFYRVLDKLALPLHICMTRLLPNQEIEFIDSLAHNVPYLGCYCLLRTGNEKAVKTIISRKYCIQVGFKTCRGLYDYVLRCIDQNIASMESNRKRGNSYTHLFNNGLEILKRLVSVSTIVQQKRIISLMCKMIDSNIILEYRVMDKWISQVLGVVDEKVKAQNLNEFLLLSTNERKNKNEGVDPFEIISCSALSKNIYERTPLDSSAVDELLHKAEQSEEQRQVIIHRLFKLFEWNLLSEEQLCRFSQLSWKKVDEKSGLPNFEQYYAAAFVRWPSPKEINAEELVRKHIMNRNWYDELKTSSFNAVTMGISRIFDEIKCLNSLYPELLSKNDKEIIIGRLIELWNSGKATYERYDDKNSYNEEFIDRYRAVVKVIGTFLFKNMRITPGLKDAALQMFLEMNAFGINTLEAESVFCETEIEAGDLTKRIIDCFYCDDNKTIVDATNAAENIIMKWPDSDVSRCLLEEEILLIRFGRQPGLQYYFISIYNLIYCDCLKLSDEMLIALNKALIECANYTAYEKCNNKTEKEIKNNILLRCSCARTAYILYRYIIQKKSEIRLEGIKLWKTIMCDATQDEFAEVKRLWIS